MKKFNVARETRILEVFEVNAKNVSDAVQLLNLQEARLLTSKEFEPKVIDCWEKPTGLTDPE